MSLRTMSLPHSHKLPRIVHCTRVFLPRLRLLGITALTQRAVLARERARVSKLAVGTQCQKDSRYHCASMGNWFSSGRQQEPVDRARHSEIKRLVKKKKALEETAKQAEAAVAAAGDITSIRRIPSSQTTDHAATGASTDPFRRSEPGGLWKRSSYFNVARKSPPQSDPLVAAIVVGGARGFVLEQVWRSLARNVLQPLGAGVHVFLCLKIQGSDAEAAAVMHASRGFEANLPPRSRLVAMRSWPTSLDASVPMAEACRAGKASAGGWRKWGVMAHDQAKCWQLAVKEERRLGRTYTLVLKTRPDAFFCSRFPAWTAFSSETRSATTVATYGHTVVGQRVLGANRGARMIRDDIGVMPRALADRYFSAVVEVTEPAACNRTPTTI